MSYKVEQACPQCAAPIEFEDTDRLLKCPFCDVRSYLYSRDYFRFVLPDKADDKDLVFVPYLRFKGTVAHCQGFKIGHRIIDVTHLGAMYKRFPISLGLRPQAMKMRFLSPETQGRFLRRPMKPNRVLAYIARQSVKGSEPLYHQTFIGEAYSVIYLPTYLDETRLVDAITNKTICNLPEGEDPYEDAMDKVPGWNVAFLATICPKCGWDLAGDKSSVVLTCNNCDTAWEAYQNKLVPVEYSTVPGQNSDSFYLPFWKVEAEAHGAEINSFADFVRTTRQPVVIRPQWEDMPLTFVIPGFKIRPRIFLRLCAQMTLSQARFKDEQTIPDANLHPVTLPRGEASQSLKITLASSAVTKKSVFPELPKIRFVPKKFTLTYYPFYLHGQDLIQEDLQISVLLKALEFGRHL